MTESWFDTGSRQKGGRTGEGATTFFYLAARFWVGSSGVEMECRAISGR